MPTKLRGMTSLEIAIIVGIVLVIAVAVGWYLYTTFTASATGQPKLNIASATLQSSGTGGTLTLRVTNPGPVDVQIDKIVIAGVEAKAEPNIIRVGESPAVTATFTDGTFTPGTTVSGSVILSGGQSFPFTATVVPQAPA